MRYYKLLPPNGRYTKDNMFVISSAAERCLMSAASFMAGFLPPLDNRNELPIPWQPVPINSIPRDRDHVSFNVSQLFVLYSIFFADFGSKKTLSEIRRNFKKIMQLQHNYQGN